MMIMIIFIFVIFILSTTNYFWVLTSSSDLLLQYTYLNKNHVDILLLSQKEPFITWILPFKMD